MKRIILLLSIIIISFFTNAQTVVEISQSLIGQKSINVIKILDSLNIVQNFYFEKNKSNSTDVKGILGLRDKNNVSFVLKLSGLNVEAGRKGTYDDYIIITTIMINFPHSSTEHMDALKQIKDYERHVGIYSTDIIIK